MHYYKRNIGDYAKKAGRLSMLQHGSYTLLLDACYDREQFPTRDEAIEWTWASSAQEIEAVEFVLRKFFTLEDGRYVQKRLQEEIAEYHAKAEVNKRIAQDRETKRKELGTKRSPVVDEPPPNQEPRTSNQEPLTKEKRERSPSGSRLPDDWVIPLDWQEWAIKERPDLEITSVISQFHDFWIAKAGKEGRKADWYATWRNWVRNQRAVTATRQQSGETAWQKSQRERVAEFAPSIARRAPGQTQPLSFIDEVQDVPSLPSR